MKLQTKLILAVSLLVLVTSAFLVGQNLLSTKNLYEENMIKHGNALLENYNSQLEHSHNFEKTLDDLLAEKILNACQTIDMVEEENYSNFLVTKIAKDLNIDGGIYVIDKDRKISYSDVTDYIGWQFPTDHPMREVFEKKSKTYMEPVRVEMVEGGKAVKYGGMYFENGFFVQIGISADTITNLQARFSSEVLLKNLVNEHSESLKYAMIVTENDEIQVATEKVDKTIPFHKDTLSKAISEQKTLSELSHDDVFSDKAFYIYHPTQLADGSSGAVVLALSTAELDSNIASNIAESVFLTLVVILIAIVIIYLLMKRLVAKPLGIIQKNMEKISNYDLTLSEENTSTEKYKHTKDEIGEIMRSMDKMVNNLINIVSNITSHAQNTAATAEELTATAQNTNEAATEVANAVGNIADGATNQAKDTEEAAQDIDATNGLLSEMTKILSSLSETIDNINLKKEEGKTALNQLLEISDENKTLSASINEVIIDTNKSAESISTASEMIQSIADQTNLLALNAAIEAARAGESGRGFAVVAEEIRKLAEDSTRFTEEIRTVIHDLKEKTQDAVDSMKIVSTKMEDQNAKAVMTQNKFTDIEIAVEKSKEVVLDVNNASKEIESRTHNATSMIQNLSAIAEENAATTEQASASVETQVSSIEDISNASENLATIAMDLQKEVSEFNL